LGMLKVIKKLVSIPVFVMIRPRGGDFCYTSTELQIMKEDIMSLKEAGADGFVLGILTRYFMPSSKGKIWKLCCPLPATFHRAIDMSRDVSSSLAKIIKLGFSRVLSSGGSQTALEGVKVLEAMVFQVRGGLTPGNLAEVLQVTKAREFHGSARIPVKSVMTFMNSQVCMGTEANCEYLRKVTSAELVSSFLKIAHDCWGV
ncbi:hypothetical protein EGW08_015909, partial [Elysia chlorotica]